MDHLFFPRRGGVSLNGFLFNLLKPRESAWITDRLPTGSRIPAPGPDSRLPTLGSGGVWWLWWGLEGSGGVWVGLVWSGGVWWGLVVFVESGVWWGLVWSGGVGGVWWGLVVSGGAWWCLWGLVVLVGSVGVW